MKLVDTYLTDEELEQLILEVEENELVAAPPDLLEHIMEGLEVSEEKASKDKVKEFRTYCFRVLTSVAAAILIIFALPNLMDTQVSDVSQRQDSIVRKEYPTKEEVLSEKSILQKAFGGNHIFNHNSELNIFK